MQHPLLPLPGNEFFRGSFLGACIPGWISDAKCSAGWAIWEGLEDTWAGIGIVKKVHEGGFSPPHHPIEIEDIFI